MNLLPIDELNKLTSYSSSSEVQDIEDEIFDLMILSYTYGNEDAKEMLGEANPIKIEEMESSIWRKTAGKDFRERIKGSPDISTLAETECHRCYIDGLTDGSYGIANYKEWVTMEDDKVRDPHRFLNGIKIPYDAYFYVDGDKAKAPNGFNKADLNVNCRCYLKLSK